MLFCFLIILLFKVFYGIWVHVKERTNFHYSAYHGQDFYFLPQSLGSWNNHMLFHEGLWRNGIMQVFLQSATEVAEIKKLFSRTFRSLFNKAFHLLNHNLS